MWVGMTGEISTKKGQISVHQHKQIKVKFQELQFQDSMYKGSGKL